MWDLRTKKAVRRYEGHGGSINAVQFHPDGACVAAGTTDATIRVWDIRTDTLLQLYNEHDGAVTGKVTVERVGDRPRDRRDSLPSRRRFFAERFTGWHVESLGCSGRASVLYSPWTRGIHSWCRFFASWRFLCVVWCRRTSKCHARCVKRGRGVRQVMVWKTNFDRFLDDGILIPVATNHKRKEDRGVPTAAAAAATVVKETHASSKDKTPGTEDGAKEAETTPPTLDQILDHETVQDRFDGEDAPVMVAGTLKHIVGELNVMSQTLGLLVQRMTLNEDKVKKLEEQQRSYMDTNVRHDADGEPH